MPKPLYAWEPNTRRFRNRQTGRFLSPAQMDTLRADYLLQEQAINADLAKRLFNKDITISQFLGEHKANLNRVYSTQYMLAKGGRNQMTPADWGVLGSQLKKQYAFADKFAQKLASGGYTESQIQKVIDRLNMYLPPSEQAYQRGSLAATYPGLKLPAHPKDGSTECSFSDGCNWRIVEQDDRWLAYWELGETEHCPTCLWRSENWNPLVVMKPG